MVDLLANCLVTQFLARGSEFALLVVAALPR
jgi:hypothetical protein